MKVEKQLDLSPNLSKRDLLLLSAMTAYRAINRQSWGNV